MENELISESFNKLQVLPSLITTFSILVVISFKRWRSVLWESALISGLTLSLLILNIIEFLTFGNFLENYEVSLRIYYSVSAVSSSIFLCLSERLNNPPLIPRKIFHFSFFIFNALLIGYILFTNHIIEGAIRNSYTISRVPGNFYWIFQSLIAVCNISAPLLILRSIFFANNPLDKKRHIVILISFIPFILTVLPILILMQLGFQINLSIFLPLSTLVFVVVYLFTENKDDLFKFLVNIPFSPERAAYKELNKRVIEYISKSQTDEKVSLREIMNEIERTFITNALEIKDGNHNLAAELLSTSISTIYRNKEREKVDQ